VLLCQVINRTSGALGIHWDSQWVLVNLNGSWACSSCVNGVWTGLNGVVIQQGCWVSGVGVGLIELFSSKFQPKDSRRSKQVQGKDGLVGCVVWSVLSSSILR
jgi:hypothetical protein